MKVETLHSNPIKTPGLLHKMMTEKTLTDITFQVGPEKMTFFGHKLIFALKCPYFYNLFLSEMSDDKERIILEDFCPRCFEHYINCCYDNLTLENIVKLISNSKNLHNFLSIVTYFGSSTHLDQVSSIILSTLDITNCIDRLVICNFYSLTSNLKIISEYIFDNKDKLLESILLLDTGEFLILIDNISNIRKIDLVKKWEESNGEISELKFTSRNLFTVKYKKYYFNLKNDIISISTDNIYKSSYEVLNVFSYDSDKCGLILLDKNKTYGANFYEGRGDSLYYFVLLDHDYSILNSISLVGIIKHSLSVINDKIYFVMTDSTNSLKLMEVSINELKVIYDYSEDSIINICKVIHGTGYRGNLLDNIGNYLYILLYNSCRNIIIRYNIVTKKNEMIFKRRTSDNFEYKLSDNFIFEFSGFYKNLRIYPHKYNLSTETDESDLKIVINLQLYYYFNNTIYYIDNNNLLNKYDFTTNTQLIEEAIPNSSIIEREILRYKNNILVSYHNESIGEKTLIYNTETKEVSYIDFYTTLVCEEYDIFISCSSKKAFNFKTKYLYSLDENLKNIVGSKLITHKDNSISVYI